MVVSFRLNRANDSSFAGLTDIPTSLGLEPNYEMRAMGFRKLFSFTFECDQICACGWDGLGRNGCLEFVFRDKARWQRSAVQHHAVKRPHAALASHSQCRRTRALDEKKRRNFQVERQALIGVE